MLVLTRRVGEEVVMCNGQITVKVLGEKYGYVRLGFQAPKNVVIDRTEIHHRKSTQNLTAEECA